MPIATHAQLHDYASAPTLISQAISGLTELQLNWSPAPGEWSTHEVVVHLADSEAVGFWRIRKTLTEQEPILAAYDQDAWANNLSYRTQNLELALKLFATLRATNVALFHSLAPDAWERKGIHEERGPLTVYELFETYNQHVAIHLQQIEDIKQALPTLA